MTDYPEPATDDLLDELLEMLHSNDNTIRRVAIAELPELGERAVPALVEALQDQDFLGAGDRVRYSVPLGGGTGPYTVDAELWFQPVAYRWAANLRSYDSFEPRRFSGYYETMASGSAVVLARASASGVR